MILGIPLVNSQFSLVDIRSYISCVMRKPVFKISDQVKHKPSCITTKDVQRLSDLGSSSNCTTGLPHYNAILGVHRNRPCYK